MVGGQTLPSLPGKIPGTAVKTGLIHVLRVMQDSSTSGAGYEQGLKSGADELVKGGKAAKKKVGATINKKANTGGKQVILAALAYSY